jgi:hypothetical protein
MTLSLPTDGWYVLANARLHASTVTGLSAAQDRDGFIRADLSIDGGRIKAIAPRGDKPLSSCRPSSIATPISTRAISGRACRTRTARSWAR